jgi:hypothetical protein
MRMRMNPGMGMNHSIPPTSPLSTFSLWGGVGKTNGLVYYWM